MKFNNKRFKEICNILEEYDRNRLIGSFAGMLLALESKGADIECVFEELSLETNKENK